MNTILEIRKYIDKVNNLSLLIEATATEIHQQYYPNIPEDAFKRIVSADKVSSNLDNDKLGEYGKWLLNLYKKGNLQPTELTKAEEYIPIFDRAKKAKKVSNPDINSYKSVDDLHSVIKNMDTEVISKKDAIKKSKLEGAELVYEDVDWKVIVPKTEEASCLYGANTKWCTAAKENNLFDQYNSEGSLYININKNTGDKYQFQFESGYFMDYLDRGINPMKIGLSDGLVEFYNKIDPFFKFRGLYRWVRDFNDGFAQVQNNDGLWNFINTNGELVSNTWFYTVAYFDDGFAQVQNQDGLWNLINTNGELVSNTWFKLVAYFDDGFAQVQNQDGLWNFINTNGELISNTWFKGISNFNNGFAQVQNQYGLWNFINTNSELVSNTWFLWVYNFKDGFAQVKNQDGSIGFIGTEGRLYDENKNLRESKIIKPNKRIMKQTIRISENQLKQIIKESVKKVLIENEEGKSIDNDNWDRNAEEMHWDEKEMEAYETWGRTNPYKTIDEDINFHKTSGKWFNYILDNATEEDAIEMALGLDWMDIETRYGSFPYLSYVDSKNGVGVYYNYGSDSYYFKDESGLNESKRRVHLA